MSRRKKRRQQRRRSGTVGAVVVAVLGVAGFAALSVAGEDVDDPVEAVDFDVPNERVRVAVLNGGGVTGMARDATRWLRSVGFDVVEIGDQRPYDPERPSVVIDRVGRVDLAGSVAEALGIDIVRTEPDPNLYVDVSVLLGSEWTRPDATGPGAAEPPSRAWWDPRGWLGR